MFMALAALSCQRSDAGQHGDGPGGSLPAPAQDIALNKTSGEKAVAVFAGGCFWCTEAVFEQLAGVQDVTSGYAGGDEKTANYDAVCTGRTGHAEVIRITYDPAKITYGALLRVFFATHDPTTLNYQGPDHGTQYRSAVFYAGAEQKNVAQAYIAQLDRAGAFPRKIVTSLEPLVKFYPAEKYHQDFVKLNANHPYVRAWALPKVKKVQEKFPEQMKDGNASQ